MLLTDGVNYNIAEAPLYFVRSGNIGIATGKLEVASERGFIWSSYAGSDVNYTYSLVINADNIIPSGYGYRNRWHAFPLRCVLEKN